ncbi:hypothetical protein BUALT_Bualt13G0109300 [Buddleja alternifolia]|uniref:Anaphase-promoting complex subunit 1 beta-sandwich domain-containing protein n=1 Tax=Buddleja alternifolia TaxID=168488 RepID=A0AAV6WU46_9LAMI|nr:hypothetical protein BUALT_Bualt13G0109300 [Buddleja alternifolia]
MESGNGWTWPSANIQISEISCNRGSVDGHASSDTQMAVGKLRDWILVPWRHLYVLATEARWIQTVDIDTGLPVYVPLELTIKETELYAETSFCEFNSCSLPELAILKAVSVCGPRYWPQVIELCPKEKPWWNPGDKNHPFNSRAMHKVHSSLNSFIFYHSRSYYE